MVQLRDPLPVDAPAEQRVMRELRRVRIRKDLDQREEKRLLRQLGTLIAEGVINQTQVAAGLLVSQPAISKSLKNVDDVPEPPEGFAGADPYEIASRYAVEEIDRAEMIRQLSRWSYAPSATTDGLHDDLLIEDSGTFADVLRAYHDGLIDAGAYDEILVGQGRQSGPA